MKDEHYTTNITITLPWSCPAQQSYNLSVSSVFLLTVPFPVPPTPHIRDADRDHVINIKGQWQGLLTMFIGS